MKPGVVVRSPPLAAMKSARLRMVASPVSSGHPPRGNLGAELLAAAGAAGVQDLAAADRRHPVTEAVPTGADQVARLKGAFHRSCL